MVLISMGGIILAAAYMLWMLQRVALGKPNTEVPKRVAVHMYPPSTRYIYSVYIYIYVYVYVYIYIYMYVCICVCMCMRASVCRYSCTCFGDSNRCLFAAEHEHNKI